VNLELVTDSALIEELSNRFDALVLVGLRDHGDVDTVEKFRWKGDYRRCQGLVFSMIARIEESRRDTTEPIEGD
jgi:hypothetical protein